MHVLKTIWHLVALCVLLECDLSTQDVADNRYSDLYQLEDELEPNLGERTQDEDEFYMYDNSPENLKEVSDWPDNKSEAKLGQVAGVAADQNDDLYVFHRADRKWDSKAFDGNHNYMKKKEGPIKTHTVLKFDGASGEVSKEDSFGDNFFYLPHGITIDEGGNFWMTDVARHQVFKFNSAHELKLTLGEEFKPGNDTSHFCKPTDVAVASNGDFFVSDGYCNSRVMKFDKDGKFLMEMGSGNLWVPHSLALAEDKDLICVADREQQRIVCFCAGLSGHCAAGEEKKNFVSDWGRVFAIAYSPKDSVIYGVNGPSGKDVKVQGFTVAIDDMDNENDGNVIETWSPSESKGFEQPHDVDVTEEGDAVFVGEIGPNKIWKFTRG